MTTSDFPWFFVLAFPTFSLIEVTVLTLVVFFVAVFFLSAFFIVAFIGLLSFKTVFFVSVFLAGTAMVIFFTDADTGDVAKALATNIASNPAVNFRIT
ncbi:MAG: hypothetical protein ACI4NO_04600 [Oxalobacter sp.]